jgi:hypothetical protein
MIQRDGLKKNVPLKWSTGTGVEVWEMFCQQLQAMSWRSRVW